jgi:hypothetical protein
MNEEQAYCQVAAEVSRGDLKAGLWAKALAESVGNENVAKSLYLKFRAQQLLSEQRTVEKRKAKQEFQASIALAKDRTVSALRRGLLLLLAVVFGFLSLLFGLGTLGVLADTDNRVTGSQAAVCLVFAVVFGFIAVACGRGMRRS